MEAGPRAPAASGHRLIFDHCHGDRHGCRPRLVGSRPDQGLVLGRGSQRRGGGADHGRDDDRRFPAIAHGPLHGEAAVDDPRMGRDGGHGCRLGRDVAQPADRLTGTISLQGRYGRMRKFFNLCATKISTAAGQPLTFIAALTVIVIWAVTGPVFHYSDTWQLIINTGTTIITFLMVFLIQSTQNRDGAAIQTKLDELIRASAAQNRYIGIEDLSEEELLALRERCVSRAQA